MGTDEKVEVEGVGRDEDDQAQQQGDEEGEKDGQNDPGQLDAPDRREGEPLQPAESANI